MQEQNHNYCSNECITEGTLIKLYNDEISELQPFEFNRDISWSRVQSLKKQFILSGGNHTEVILVDHEEGYKVIVDGHHRVLAMQEALSEHPIKFFTLRAKKLDAIWGNTEIAKFKAKISDALPEKSKNILKYNALSKNPSKDISLLNKLATSRFGEFENIRIGLTDIFELNPYRLTKRRAYDRKYQLETISGNFRFKEDMFNAGIDSLELTIQDQFNILETIACIILLAEALDRVQSIPNSFKFSTIAGRYTLRFLLSENVDMKKFCRNILNTNNWLKRYYSNRYPGFERNQALESWFSLITCVYWSPNNLREDLNKHFVHKYQNNNNKLVSEPVFFKKEKLVELLSIIKNDQNYV